MVVSEIIDIIMEKMQVPVLPSHKTCDHIIIGKNDMDVTKIATTFMATVDVIKEAAAQNVNFIITHEPTWYTGLDATDWLEEDCVYLEKRRMIEEHQMTIWRFHDHMHMAQGDAIYNGFEAELSWGQYCKPVTGSLAGFGKCYQIPRIRLDQLARELKKVFAMDVIQIVGSPDTLVEHIGVLVGGGSLGLGIEERPMQLMREAALDLLICGDITEWTTAAYVRDAAALGQNKAMLMLGHERSEEAGMKHLARWLEQVFPQIETCFIDAKEPFLYL